MLLFCLAGLDITRTTARYGDYSSSKVSMIVSASGGFVIRVLHLATGRHYLVGLEAEDAPKDATLLVGQMLN